MEKDRVVIFGAGTGLLFFSTDTVAAQRALQIRAHQVLNPQSGVDGVDTAVPNVDLDAKEFDHLPYDQAIGQNIRVMDLTAMTMCKNNNIDMLVVGMEGDGN